MMNKDDKYNVTVSIATVEKMLKGVIEHENADLLSKVIANHLGDFGVEQFFDALSGIAPTSKFTEGQEVLIPIQKACGWQFKETDQTDNIVNGKYIKGNVLSINPYRKDSVTVTCGLYKNGKLEYEMITTRPYDLIVERYD